MSWLTGIPPLGPGDIQSIDRGFRMRVQAVQAIDRMIGQIRSTLSALGLDNTYVVFSSDNGLHMGEYSLRPGKMTPFDIDIRVPLVVVGPGVPKGHVVSAIGYYDLKQDPEELANVAARLPAAKLSRLRDILRANRECRGAQACWDAQRLVP